MTLSPGKMAMPKVLLKTFYRLNYLPNYNIIQKNTVNRFRRFNPYCLNSILKSKHSFLSALFMCSVNKIC